MQGVRADLRLGRLQLLARDELRADLGVEDRAERLADLVSNWRLEITQRIRCWMRVFGTPALTL